jgi:lysozyme
MRTSADGVAFIAAHEGVVTRAYRDVAGVWTIGVGHTAAAGPPRPEAGMTITREEAFAILARDLPRYERRVAAALPDAGQAVFDGAVSFDFNTGAIDRASWVRIWRSGDRATARRLLMAWTRAGGRTVAGLVRRREAEARLIFEADYGGWMSEDVSGGGRTGGTVLPSVLRPLSSIQSDLATLGFYKGSLDGIAGPATRAAIIAYQRSHSDLVADGVVGRATLASIARDIAARRSVGGAVGGAIGTAIAGGSVLGAGGARPALVAIFVICVAIAAVAGVAAFRHRDELKRAIQSPSNHGT